MAYWVYPHHAKVCAVCYMYHARCFTMLVMCYRDSELCLPLTHLAGQYGPSLPTQVLITENPYNSILYHKL